MGEEESRKKQGKISVNTVVRRGDLGSYWSGARDGLFCGVRLLTDRPLTPEKPALNIARVRPLLPAGNRLFPGMVRKILPGKTDDQGALKPFGPEKVRQKTPVEGA